ncbi:MAG: DUF3999 family protein [Bacteroidales bacterium]|nr:DUF3999 family protein [Bacteroidales bacterium]
MKLKIVVLICLVNCLPLYLSAQMDKYRFQREIHDISSEWHQILLPGDIYSKASSAQLSDIRIFGITAGSDTIEAPYLLHRKMDRISQKRTAFKTINTSYNEKGHYFTFEIPDTEIINHIRLNFKQPDFDWKIKLEGSKNQQEWFTIVDDYRIVSIKNDLTDYQFTDIIFPDSRYRYLRLLVKSNDKPELAGAEMTFNEAINGIYREYPYRIVNLTNHKEQKQTEIEVDLGTSVPVSSLTMFIHYPFDFYRPVVLDYSNDSIRTEQGVVYKYRRLLSATLSSVDKGIFRFDNTVLRRIKITIHNQDNRPLDIDSLEIKGNFPELMVRFDQPGRYFLCYGNDHVSKPEYDIERFSGKIPETMAPASLGDEQIKETEETTKVQPLFLNKAWLWTIMILIILLLGWFSLKMIKRNE